MIIYSDNPKTLDIYNRLLNSEGLVRNFPLSRCLKTVQEGNKKYKVLTGTEIVEFAKGDCLCLSIKVIFLLLFTLGFALLHSGFRLDTEAACTGKKTYKVYRLIPEETQSQPPPIVSQVTVTAAPVITPAPALALPVQVNLVPSLHTETERKVQAATQAQEDPEIVVLRAKLISDPKSLLSPPASGSHLRKMIGYPAICECHCCELLSRKNETDDLRNAMDSKLIDHIQKKFPLKDFPELVITSLASGGCFHELVLHAKLTALGYRIKWILVDPRYLTETDTSKRQASPTITSFTYLAQRLAPGTEVSQEHDFESYFDSVARGTLPKAHIDLLLDFDVAGAELVDRERWKQHVPRLATKPPSEAYLPIITKLQLLLEHRLTHPRLSAQIYRGHSGLSAVINDYAETTPGNLSCTRDSDILRGSAP